MKPPPGLVVLSPNTVCKLNKSLYGLKQASRRWNAKLSNTLRELGFQHPKNDYSLFTKQQGNSLVLLAVYADDIVITGNNPEEISALKDFLDEKFKIKDLGELHYFLGIEIIRVSNGLILTHKSLP